MLKKFSLCLFTGLCICVIIHAQSSSDAFNEYYRKSIDKVQDLAKNKLSYFDCDTSIRRNYTDLVFEMLRSYREKSDSVGALFYFIKQDSLSIWLAKKNKLYEKTVKISKDELLKIEADLRASLRVEKLDSAKMLGRGGDVISTDTGIDPEQAIRKATSILLPDNIASQLDGLLHLIIIPEFNIGRFPFYVFKPFNSGDFLVDRLSVSFAPHLCNLNGFRSYYGNLFGRPNKIFTENILVVGNPAYDSSLPKLKSLPGAEEEAVQVAKIFGTTAYTGKDAKKSEMIRKAQYADLLYFATHGMFNMQTVLEGSFLAFAPDSDHSTGLWTASEIQENHFRARLAVLSACQTGIGKIYEGGFFGIGRTFFIAGVANTVTSLWSVNDLATKELMILFATQLTQEDYFFPSQHLRKAIIQYKADGKKSPADWASFMVFGYSF